MFSGMTSTEREQSSACQLCNGFDYHVCVLQAKHAHIHDDFSLSLIFLDESESLQNFHALVNPP